jgi:hypothetical protein
MEPIVLYCKSYRGDVLRAKRLAVSLQKFNADKIPFYISVPEADLELFQERLSGQQVVFLSDEEIVRANPKHELEYIRSMPGTLSQQVVKSDFWRLNLCENYVCLDSDNEFLRNFYKTDFLTPDGHPYTVITEGKEFLEFSARYHLPKVPENFTKDSKQVQELFGRTGRAYSFGIPPLVWSRKVWISLEEGVLNPRGQSLADLIVHYPHELRLYGEALLKFRAIQLWPCEDIFKNYLYQSQYFFDKKRGITADILSENYLGIVLQSNWEGDHFGAPRKSVGSRLIRKLKRFIRWLSV